MTTTKSQAIATPAVAPLPVGGASKVRTIKAARIPTGSAVAALLALMPEDAPAVKAEKQPKWLEDSSHLLTAGQTAFLHRIGYRGAVAYDNDPQKAQPSYSAASRQDCRITAKLRKAAKPGGTTANAILTAMFVRGDLSTVDCLAIFKDCGVPMNNLGTLGARLAAITGYTVTLQDDGTWQTAGRPQPGFYQKGYSEANSDRAVKMEDALISLGAEALERQYKMEAE